MNTTYINKFYSKHYQGSRPVITAYAEPTKYKGYLIYERTTTLFDTVKDGVCIAMSGSLNYAKKRIDNNDMNTEAPHD